MNVNNFLSNVGEVGFLEKEKGEVSVDHTSVFESFNHPASAWSDTFEISEPKLIDDGVSKDDSVEEETKISVEVRNDSPFLSKPIQGNKKPQYCKVKQMKRKLVQPSFFWPIAPGSYSVKGVCHDSISQNHHCGYGKHCCSHHHHMNPAQSPGKPGEGVLGHDWDGPGHVEVFEAPEKMPYMIPRTRKIRKNKNMGARLFFWNEEKASAAFSILPDWYFDHFPEACMRFVDGVIYRDDLIVDSKDPVFSSYWRALEKEIADLIELSKHRVTSVVCHSKRVENKPKEVRIMKRQQGKRVKNGPGQKECCMNDCDKSVENRLRFSLRLAKLEDFKDHFIKKNWNKVCKYHYFNDLYRWKKLHPGKKTNEYCDCKHCVNWIMKPPKPSRKTKRRSLEAMEDED